MQVSVLAMGTWAFDGDWGHFDEDEAKAVIQAALDGGVTLSSNRFADVSLAQWLTLTPHELVRAHLNIDESVLASIRTSKSPVGPA